MTQAFNLSQLANKVNSSGQLDVATGVTGTQAVANGGTGQSTYTNGQVLIGNSTGNTLTKTTLTAGAGISVTNGAGSITIANTLSNGFTNMQVFNSPGTFTTPATTTQIKVTVVGGGGNSLSVPAPGGTPSNAAGAGGAAIYVGPVSSLTPYPVTVGAATQTSSFGSLASATGGPGTNPTQSGGAGTAGTLQITGGSGGSGGTQNPLAMGGSSIFGGSGAIGSGSNGRNAGNSTPGVGTTGVVIVEF